MKYQRWYDQIIERARFRELVAYTERHHIVPRSWGGSDDAKNLVELTYREHFLVHWLLTKISSGYARRQMLYALHCMTFQITGGRIVASWQFAVAKEALRREVERRLRARRARIKEDRRQKYHETIARAAAVEPQTESINPHYAEGRAKLTALTRTWIKADPARMRRKSRRAVR